VPVYTINFRKRRNRSKKKCDRIHSIRRSSERFRKTFSKKQRKEAIRRIQNNEATFVRRSSNTRTIWDNAVPGLPNARVVYSKITKEIVTMWDKSKS
jgi:hypothetical protein